MTTLFLLYRKNHLTFTQPNQDLLKLINELLKQILHNIVAIGLFVLIYKSLYYFTIYFILSARKNLLICFREKYVYPLHTYMYVICANSISAEKITKTDLLK